MSACKEEPRNVNEGSSSSSANGAAPLPDDAPAVAEMKPARTQLAISELLKVPALPPGQVPMEAMTTLRQMEKRSIPANLSNQLFELKHNPKTCCFDAAASTWCAHQLCQRCAAFNQVLQASKADTSSAMLSGVLGLSLCVTDCLSDSRREGRISKLPLELLDNILKHVIEEMRISKIGTTVATLMHVSSYVRYQVVKAFARLKLYDVALAAAPLLREVHLPDDLVSFMCPLIRWHLQDISFQRYSTGNQPTCVGLDPLFFTTGARVQNASCSLSVSRVGAPQVGASRHFLKDQADFGVKQVALLLDSTLKQCKSKDRDAQPGDKTSEFPPRILNMHQRALSGSLGDPAAGITIDLSFTFKASITDSAAIWCTRRWKYVTKPY